MPQLVNRKKFVNRAQEYGARLLYAPEVVADPLTNLGSLALPAGVLKNGAALKAPGMIEGSVSALLDGVNDFIDTEWLTRTNRMTNPSFEVDLTDWINDVSNATMELFERVFAFGWAIDGGIWGLRVKAKSTANGAFVRAWSKSSGGAGGFPVTAGQKYTISGVVNVTTLPAKAPKFYIRWMNAANAVISDSSGGAATIVGVNEPSFTVTAPAGAVACHIMFGHYNQGNTLELGETTNFIIDSVMLEQAEVVGEYFPKTSHITNGEAGWSGTTGKSTSQMGPFANGTTRVFAGVATRPSTGTAVALLGSSSGVVGSWVRLTIAKETKNVFFTVNGGVNQVSWENAWPAINTTTIWVLIFDEKNDTAELYINGVSQGVKAVVQQHSVEPGRAQLGIVASVTEPWIGNILPFALFQKTLTVKQIEELSVFTTSRVAVTRELPPDQLAFRIDPPGGQSKRWAEDEPNKQDILSDMVLADEMPGGCKDSGGTLARDPRVEYGDIRAFSKAYAYQPGVEKVWEGYFDKAPEISGDNLSLSPSLVGNQKHLEGNKAIKLGFIDADLNKWGDPTLARRAYLLANNIKANAAVSVGFSSLDPAGTAPGIVLDFNNVEAPAATEIMAGEADYYGEGIDIGEVWFDYRQITAYPEDGAWDSTMVGGRDDVFKTYLPASPTDYNRTAVAQIERKVVIEEDGFKYLRLRDMRNPTGAITQLKDVIAWQNIKVFGRHGLVPKGIWPFVGFSAKQMLEYGVPNYAAPLTINPEYMEDDGYVIPQAWYPDSNMGDAVKDITKFGLYDWFVYFDELFQHRQPGSYGRFWKAYMGPSNLQEQGLDSERLWESIVVSYTDVDGTTRTVGPPGSGATVEDERLRITDPDHPAVRAELTRRDILDLQGIGTPETAIAVGVRFLQEASLLPRSGSATLTGYVLDNRGNMRPAAQVRSGDWISIVDASDTSYRKIVNKNYTHGSRGAEIDIDAPPSGLEALLERLQVELIPLGIA